MKEIIKALIGFHKEKPPIHLNRFVSYRDVRFKYADLGEIISKATPVLLKNGLCFTQVFEANGISTCLWHLSGESISSHYQLPDSTMAPQDLGTWTTYVKRYQLASILGLVADDDNDGGIIPDEDVLKSALKELADCKTKADLKNVNSKYGQALNKNAVYLAAGKKKMAEINK